MTTTGTTRTTAGPIARWLLPSAPAERLAAVRIFVGAYALVYVLARFRYFADLSRHQASEFQPVGIAHLVGTPLPLLVTHAVALASIALGAAFVVGYRFRVSAPAFFVTLLWMTTYRSSFGKILHTENLLVCHVFVLACAPAADAFVLRLRRNAPAAVAPTDAARALPASSRYGLPLRAMGLAVVLTYLVAGISKLRTGGGAWLDGQALGDWLAYDALRKIELGSVASPLGPWLAERRLALVGLSWLTLGVELGAPLALVSRRFARLWVVLAWGFHAGILATMAIGFFYPLTLVAFAPLLDAERAIARGATWLAARRARTARG